MSEATPSKYKMLRRDFIERRNDFEAAKKRFDETSARFKEAQARLLDLICNGNQELTSEEIVRSTRNRVAGLGLI